MGYDLHLDPEAHVYSHARALIRHPAFDLLGAVETDGERCRTFERVYQRPAYGDLERALAELRPDVVVVAVPTPLHGATLERILGGARPAAVLCEKPLSFDVAEARAMREACEARGVRLYVNYMRRSDPGAIEVARRLAAGEIASPVKAVVWYSKGFFHNGSHFFNLLEYWLGRAESVDVIAAGRLWDGHDPEPDVRVRFARGSAVFLAAWEEAYSHYTVELVASNGRLRYERGGEEILWQASGPDPVFEGYTVLARQPESIPSGMDRFQWHAVDQLARALTGGEAHICSGTAACTTLETMHTIMEQR
jgi:predicted dehydrogenase